MTGVLRQYNGDSLYLAAFAVCLALLYFSGKKNKSSTGKKAVLAVLLSVLFVFNELAYRIVGKFTNAATYYRFFWMFPVAFLIAYQLTKALFSKKKIQVLSAVLAFLLCLGVGANFFFFQRENINRPKNIYGLSPDALVMADEMIKDWNGGTGQEGTDRLPCAAFDMYLEYQVRTYEPRIVWGISRKAYLYQAKHGYDGRKYVREQHMIAAVNEGIREDNRALRRSLDKKGVDYLVIRTEFDMDRYLSEISVLPIAQSENYTLYRVK